MAPICPVFKKNDRIVFLGDSITEQQLYTNYVESYLTLRYPGHNLTFFNAGWGGDVAPGGLQRLERDVMSLSPDLVTLCYGMNDGQYTTPKLEVQDPFLRGMRGLLERFKKEGIRVVLLTPGYADEKANPSLAKVSYNTRGLRRLSDLVLELARDYRVPVFDIHALMNQVDARGKKAEKDFCMAPDGFHPNPAGHLVMAHGLLQALGVPALSLKAQISLPSGRARTSRGVRLSDFKLQNGGIRFSVSLDRFPFYIEPAARAVLPYLPFEESYNQLIVSIRGLSKGFYYFRGELDRSRPYSAAELARGVNLYSLWEVLPLSRPQAVHKFTNDKCQTYYRVWRDLSLLGQPRETQTYDREIHRLGIKAMPVWDRARRELAVSKASPFTVRLVPGHAQGATEIDNRDYVGRWKMRGPFKKPYAKDYLGGEAAVSAGKLKTSTGWKRVHLNLKNLGNGLGELYGPVTDCLAYALAEFQSPADQSAELLLGSDDGFAVYLNGARLASRLDLQRGVVPDQDRIKVRFKKGRNLLLLKISQGSGNWGFCVRFAGLVHPLIETTGP